MKILNFGSMNLDYVYQVVHFVSGGETESAESMQIFCGGKGLNQSIALAKAGAVVYHAGKLGINGERLLQELNQHHIHTELIGRSEEVTGHAIIQIDCNGQNCILLHGGANHTVTQDYIDWVFSHFEDGDMVVLQNEINMMEEIIQKAKQKKMKIALNPSPIRENIFKIALDGITYFLLNEIEGKALTGKSDFREIADALVQKYPGSAVVLTVGKQGVLYRDANTLLRHGIYDTKVVDTTAAGDTFTGYFIAAVSEGQTVQAALQRASIASSISVSRHGAAPSIPLREEVNEAIQNPTWEKSLISCE